MSIYQLLFYSQPYEKQNEEILHWFESSVGSVSVIQGFFHIIVVDIVAIFHTYRQVILTLLLCGQSRMYSQVDLGAVQLTELSLGRYVCCHCLSLGRCVGVAYFLHSFLLPSFHSYPGYCFTEACLKKLNSFVQDCFV